MRTCAGWSGLAWSGLAWPGECSYTMLAQLECASVCARSYRCCCRCTHDIIINTKRLNLNVSQIASVRARALRSQATRLQALKCERASVRACVWMESHQRRRRQPRVVFIDEILAAGEMYSGDAGCFGAGAVAADGAERCARKALAHTWTRTAMCDAMRS